MSGERVGVRGGREIYRSISGPLLTPALSSIRMEEKEKAPALASA